MLLPTATRETTTHSHRQAGATNAANAEANYQIVMAVASARSNDGRCACKSVAAVPHTMPHSVFETVALLAIAGALIAIGVAGGGEEDVDES